MNGTQFNVQFGKVRINTAINAHQRILTSTSRISAFDCVLPFEVENKGQILQAISTFFFINTRDIVPNHFIGCLDAQSMLVRSGKVLPLEVIVRATLSGSLWKAYSTGGAATVQQHFGVQLPEGLSQNARFPKPIVTFTTKAAFGHDEVVTAQGAQLHVKTWLQTEVFSETQHGSMAATTAESFAAQLVEQVQHTALRLFARGQEIALKAQLLLLDTKYEFALDEDNQLMLVDEIHTPDASRYVELAAYDKGEIKHLSKEWLREILQSEISAFEKTARPADKNQPFVLRPFWASKELKKTLSEGLSAQYQELFARLFPQLSLWDLISPHLLPWPVDPVQMRQAEHRQRLPARVLVIGNGGRDYTLASAIEKAAEVDVVYCWPGRESWIGDKKTILGPLTSDELLQFCAREQIGWAVFGPEMPIAQGLAERLREKNIPCLAPDLQGAMLESSKIHCKEILQKAGCPTAEAWTVSWSELQTCGTSDDRKTTAHAVLDQYPYVLKYESLASGKGVCLVFNAQDRAAAITHFSENLPGWLKELSTVAVDTFTRRANEPQFLVEKLLPGREISAIALCNGEDYALLPYAQDYKRRDNGQTGPNTGGMGAVCPVNIPPALDEQIHNIFKKTLSALARNGHPYRGFLFAGLMVDDNNLAQVLEFNCRLGDPETQVILPGLGRDLLLNMWLTSQNLSWHNNPRWNSSNKPTLKHDGLWRCFVVVAAPEYPNGSSPRRTLSLPETWETDCQWIPSGVDADGQTSAGRMGGVLCTAQTPELAVQKAYVWASKIGFSGGPKDERPHYRTDIDFPNLEQDNTRA